MKRDTGSIALGPLEPADEADLIERCRAEERAAHDELYHRFRRQVAGNLYRVLGDRSDLEDLVQEVFVIAFRGLSRFRGDARLSTWLYRICVNVALGRIRTRKRRPSAIGVADLDAASPDPSLTERPETPDRSLERRQDQERVYRALEQLAPKKRIVLYLHEIEGLDLKEIAYLVDSNPVTVRTRLFYARREFYRAIAGPAAEGPAAADDAGGESPSEASSVQPSASRGDRQGAPGPRTGAPGATSRRTAGPTRTRGACPPASAR